MKGEINTRGFLTVNLATQQDRIHCHRPEDLQAPAQLPARSPFQFLAQLFAQLPGNQALSSLIFVAESAQRPWLYWK